MTDAKDPLYDLKSVSLPYLSGPLLRLFVTLLEGPLGGLLIPGLLRSSGASSLRGRLFEEAPTSRPLHFTRERCAPSAVVPTSEWPGPPAHPGSGFHFSTVHDYAQAYRSGLISPEEVARQTLEAIAADNAADPPMRAIIAVDHEDVLRQAQESTRRIQSGQPRSVFEGVPVAVKDELDMTPYPTTVGTAFLGKASARADATVVARMRAAGALLIGKANMHEIGIGVTGQNPIHGTPRNPYALDRYTGGSSSGPAAAVAAGLCPVALGADGGGSIRIPAAFCGVVGLKPTYGRISEHGAAPLCWSVAHLGPLAATATAAALAYAVMAGPDLNDPGSLHQPAPTLAGWDDLDLRDVTLGVYRPWFAHATDDMTASCAAMLKQFEQMGATVRDVAIPDLEAGRVAHTLTIAGEMAQALDYTYAEHHRQHGLDVRLNLALARAFTTRDYVQAQRVRTRLIANFSRALEQVDAVVTPATGLVAPLIPQAALQGGDSDLTMLVEIMRFVTPANLTGLPALAFPVGYTPDGLPVGMQLIGRPWQEAMLLRLALASEQVVVRAEPRRCHRMLPE